MTGREKENERKWKFGSSVHCLLSYKTHFGWLKRSLLCSTPSTVHSRNVWQYIQFMPTQVQVSINQSSSQTMANIVNALCCMNNYNTDCQGTIVSTYIFRIHQYKVNLILLLSNSQVTVILTLALLRNPWQLHLHMLADRKSSTHWQCIQYIDLWPLYSSYS